MTGVCDFQFIRKYTQPPLVVVLVPLFSCVTESELWIFVSKRSEKSLISRQGSIKLFFLLRQRCDRRLFVTILSRDLRVEETINTGDNGWTSFFFSTGSERPQTFFCLIRFLSSGSLCFIWKIFRFFFMDIKLIVNTVRKWCFSVASSLSISINVRVGVRRKGNWRDLLLTLTSVRSFLRLTRPVLREMKLSENDYTFFFFFCSNVFGFRKKKEWRKLDLILRMDPLMGSGPTLCGVFLSTISL